MSKSPSLIVASRLISFQVQRYFAGRRPAFDPTLLESAERQCGVGTTGILASETFTIISTKRQRSCHTPGGPCNARDTATEGRPGRSRPSGIATIAPWAAGI